MSRTASVFFLAGVLVMVGLAVWSVKIDGQAFPTCLHGEDASVANRARREGALAVARAVNAAQGAAAEKTRSYQRLAGLLLPNMPDGFVLRFYTDGNGYLLALKDERDPCRYAIFADQEGLYEAVQSVPQMAS